METSRFFIVSGTSGSGKTIALQVLEDLGYYCVDNLPASLLPDMAQRAQATAAQPSWYAISIDSRNSDSIGDLKTYFENLSGLNIDWKVLFLDADDSVLLKRYSETRRKHPLSDKETSLEEAIKQERHLLEPISNIALHKVDTSNTTPHELRSEIRNFAAAEDKGAMTLLVQSFGFKYGNPRDADFVFDVRCLPNPHWQPDLKNLTGLDEPVKEFLAAEPICDEMFAQVRDFIDTWLPHFINDNRNYMTLAIGCTGGQHRSVYLANLLHKHFSQNPRIQTQVRHRELNV